MLFRYPFIVLIYLVPAILLSLSFHEYSHAFTSYKLGDPTAKNSGRLSLNPLKHLDILGTLMILVSFFGWAKPVPINPMYYKNRKKGTMLVSIAGPLSNIILAFIFSIPMVLIGIKYNVAAREMLTVYNSYLSNAFDYESIIFNLSRFFYIINVSLAVFNILPVPPLDGSKILSGILPSRQYFKMMQYENYIGIIFLAMVFVFPGALSKIMYPFLWFVETALYYIVTPIINILA